MIRFLHTADWQIGKPYLSVEDDQKRFRLQQERLQVISRIGEIVQRQAASFVLVAGDLFDSPTVPTAAVMEVMEAIGSLEVPVLVTTRAMKVKSPLAGKLAKWNESADPPMVEPEPVTV